MNTPTTTPAEVEVRLRETLDALPSDVVAALERGWKPNAYERTLGGFYVCLGPITNRPLLLATVEDEDIAEFIVAALRLALAAAPEAQRHG